MATIKDIAQIAGVSSMTVTNIIHGRMDKVSGETAQRVQKIIDELGYTPNMYARSLVNSSSKVVTYIKIKTDAAAEGFISDPFTAEFVDALEASLSAIGYYLMVKTVTCAAELKTFLGNWRVDGIVIIGLCDEAIRKLLADCSVPVVLIDSYIGLPSAQSIRIDDDEGGFLATEYLLQQGHRNIAVAAPSFPKNGLNLVRLSGYHRALQAHSIPLREELIFDYAGQSVSRLAQAIQQSGVSAVFAFSDLLALELMREFRSMGIEIPRDISIVGFDDLNLCTLAVPPLTTVRQNTKEKGRLAAQCMTELLKNPQQLTAQEIVMSVSLVERESVKSL